MSQSRRRPYFRFQVEAVKAAAGRVAVGSITREAKVGRAEALRRAMLAMIDTGEARETHPAYWAPSWWAKGPPQSSGNVRNVRQTRKDRLA